LAETAKAMAAEDQGLLATDESNPACETRSAALGIPTTVKARQSCREMILTTPGLGSVKK
jgi:fructose-bisphosphate aldolase class I